MERHCGHASSRVKDLVDLVIYALTVDLKMDKLTDAMHRELSMRGMRTEGEFALPPEWGSSHARQYEKLAAAVHLPAHLRKMEGGLSLAKQMLDPVFAGGVRSTVWDHRALRWLDGQDRLNSRIPTSRDGQP